MTINPKAVTIDQLMGRYDETSREWADGLLSHAIRSASNDTSGKEMIVTFDGPLEPDWVENINSVLDDNKRLNLVTGEVVYLSPSVKIVLESADLKHCTPATISRCAIIYFQSEAMMMKAHFNSWLLRLPNIIKDQQKRLDQFFNFFIGLIIPKFVVPEKLIHPLSTPWLVYTFTMVLDSFIQDYRNAKYTDKRVMKRVMQKIEEEIVSDTTSGIHGVEDTVLLTFNKQQSFTNEGQQQDIKENFRRMTTVSKQGMTAFLDPKGSQNLTNNAIVSSHLTSQIKIRPPDYRWCEDEQQFENSIRFKKLWVDSFFVLAVIWSVGSLLNE